MMQSAAAAGMVNAAAPGMPPGWVSSRRGGWHNPDCAGYTGIIKPHKSGRSYGWAVYGAGRRQIAGWHNARTPALAAAAAERAAIAAAAERMDGAGAALDRARAGMVNAGAELAAALKAPAIAGPAPTGPLKAPAGLSRLRWCSICGKDTAAPARCYGMVNADGELAALCADCYAAALSLGYARLRKQRGNAPPCYRRECP